MTRRAYHLPSYLIALCLAITAPVAVHGQDNFLFAAVNQSLNPAQSEIAEQFAMAESTIQTRVVKVNPIDLQKYSVTANLFEGFSTNLVRQNIGKTGISLKTWTGRTTEGPGSAVFVLAGNKISGHIAIPEGNFELVPLDNDGLGLLIEHDPTAFGGCDNEHTVSTESPTGADQPLDQDDDEDSAQNITRSPEESECVIRVLIGYTDLAKTKTLDDYNRSMIEHVSLAIAQMNQGYANSLIDQRVELAYLYNVADSETTSTTNDVNALQDPEDGKWDEIHELRDLYHADMVALITGGTYNGSCGRAYGFDYEDADGMFQLSEYNCITANFTLAHEFGHLQGCRHDIDPATTPFSYGHGYNYSGTYRTIMAVCCGETRINYWSNPFVFYGSTGSMGTINLNYNALALNNSYSTVSGHKMNPDSINSENMLPSDHVITATTMGGVISTDTTMSDGCLVLQSESQVRLTSGFKSYKGSLGQFRIINGCGESAPFTVPSAPVVQRDGRAIANQAERGHTLGQRRDN